MPHPREATQWRSQGGGRIGAFDGAGHRPEFDAAAPGNPQVTSRHLDVLGNWSAGTGGTPDSVRRFADADSDFTYDDSGLEQTSSILDHDNTNLSNEIAGRTYYDPGKTLLGETTPFIYDAAGNLVDDDEHQYVYDAWNRLVKVNTISKNRQGEKSYGALVAYAYDALGRRVARYDEQADTADYFHYDGNRVVEEWHDGDTDNQFNVAARRRQYVWGLDYIDELVAQSNGPATSSTDYFVHQDANYNVVALTLAEDASSGGPLAGTLVEQYSYTPYGEPFALENGGGEVLPSGVPSTNIGHQGLWREFLVDFYHNRARTYFFKLGRFGQKDPKDTAVLVAAALVRNGQRSTVALDLNASGQYQDGMSVYAYLRSGPIGSVDPRGLAADCKCGPDITDAIISHLNRFIVQASGDVWPQYWLALGQFGDPARDNGVTLMRAAQGIGNTEGCGTGACTGTVTLCDMCISGYHIDHILVMSYFAGSFGIETARAAGQYNESSWIGALNEGEEFEGHSDPYHNADLTFNEVALCFASAMKHAKANNGTTDLLTKAELCKCTKAVSALQRSAIAAKPGRGSGNTGYDTCQPCEERVPTQRNLVIPPIQP